jgi:MinD superfamily P-loop ATPase
MYRVIEVCQHFSVSAAVCINKCDINDSTTQQIKDYCQVNSIKVVAEIPYDDVITEALVHNLPVVEWANNRVTKQINLLWEEIQRLLELSKEIQSANLSV